MGELDDALNERLRELADKHEIVGASIAMHSPAGVGEAAYGVTNNRTAAPVSTDTVFQIGSITKVYTATLVMQLVDEGLVELDTPVKSYVPDLRLPTPEATETVTVRQLLCHTSGIDGDFFKDFGRGDDCLEKFVAELDTLDMISAPGTFMSYCNSGFVLCGLMLERLTGTQFDQLLRERLLDPLGADTASMLPEDALLHRAAVGHLPNPENVKESQPTTRWQLPRCIGPAGLLQSTADDVLSFAKLHLAGGVTPDGTRSLSEQSVRAMQVAQVDVPDRWAFAQQWGLGWFLNTWDGELVYGHDGGTIGQAAFLRVAPASDVAVVLLTNGPGARAVFQGLVSELLQEFAGCAVPRVPPAPETSAPDVDLSKYVGTYACLGAEFELGLGDGALAVRLRDTGPIAELSQGQPEEAAITLVDRELGILTTPSVPSETPFVFFDFDGDGRPRHAHYGARALRRLS
jgi:CubicO group peptidase (beta-lactamase class C family)